MRRGWRIVLHSPWLLGEFAKQRMYEYLQDADAWRRARLAEQAQGPPPAERGFDGGFARRTVVKAWGVACATASVLMRATRAVRWG
jgi:hypothetical protein